MPNNKSSDTQTMLRAIINGQSSMKSDLIKKIDDLDKKLTGRIDSLDQKIDGVEERLTKRINIIGKSVAYLEDDAPTREEHDNLEKRVKKVEKKLALV